MTIEDSHFDDNSLYDLTPKQHEERSRLFAENLEKAKAETREIMRGKVESGEYSEREVKVAGEWEDVVVQIIGVESEVSRLSLVNADDAADFEKGWIKPSEVGEIREEDDWSDYSENVEANLEEYDVDFVLLYTIFGNDLYSASFVENMCMGYVMDSRSQNDNLGDEERESLELYRNKRDAFAKQRGVSGEKVGQYLSDVEKEERDALERLMKKS